MDALILKRRLDLMDGKYTSNSFLPIIGLKRSTLHQWIGRGYFCIEQPGTGRTLELIGEELFALAALVCLSRMGWGPNSYVRGLRDSSRIYFRAYREMETPPLRYCVAKGTTFEVEWELSDKPNVEHPIVGACGSKVLPCWAVFDFQDLMERLLVGMEEIRRFEQRSKHPEYETL